MGGALVVCLLLVGAAPAAAQTLAMSGGPAGGAAPAAAGPSAPAKSGNPAFDQGDAACIAQFPALSVKRTLCIKAQLEKYIVSTEPYPDLVREVERKQMSVAQRYERHEITADQADRELAAITPDYNSAVAARQQNQGAPATATLGAKLSGRRLALRVVGQCAGDPDPVGALSSDTYSRCDQNELARLRSWIAAALAGAYSVGGDNPNFILTVTLTREMSTQGAAGLVTDLAPASVIIQGNYSLSDPGGRVLRASAIAYEGPAGFSVSADEEREPAEQQFALKIANAVVAGSRQ